MADFGLGHVAITQSWFCPPEKILHLADPATDRRVIVIHPWRDPKTMEYRPPFYTRYCRGVQEAERDRRRQRKLRGR